MSVKSVIIRHGSIIDSVMIDGNKVGTSTGGTAATFQLAPGETLSSITADRVTYES